MFKRTMLTRTALTAATAAMCLSTVLAPTLAAAQSSGSVDVPVPPRSDQSPPPSPGGSYDNRAYQDQGPSGPGDNRNYDNRNYDNRAYDNRYDQHAQSGDYGRDQRDYDRERAQWAHDNCVQQKSGSTAAGVVVGGILGALIGSGLGERGSRSTAAAIGGVSGAAIGGAVGHSSGGECPPGYAYRGGGYAEGAYHGGYAGGAPPPPPPAYYAPPPAYYYGGPVVYEPGVVYGGPPPVYYGPSFGFWYGGHWGGHRYWGRRW